MVYVTSPMRRLKKKEAGGNLRLTSVSILFVGWLLAACAMAAGHHDDAGDADDGDANTRHDAGPCVTSISGKVFAPNGVLPLYGVLVYVPVADPPPFTPGVQCGRCSRDVPGGAIASDITDASGAFRLEGVPAGADLPVIVTIGKWRRRVTVPTVTRCQDTPVADRAIRLPRNRSEGEMPRIAQVTGGCDGLACVLAKIGIDASEFGTSSSGPQAVTFYNGVGGSAPGAPQPAASLWGDLEELKKFDLVINACECDEHTENKGAPDLLRQYADLGGRVYGSHFHYTWTKHLVPPWRDTATWVDSSDVRGPDLVDTSHPGGDALASWLLAVGASTTYGHVALGNKIPNASTVVAPTTRWLYSPGSGMTHYLSFQTPVGVPAREQCGKVVYAGMHVSSGSVTTTFPSGCSTAFTPDEQALVFLLFDLLACNQDVE